MTPDSYTISEILNNLVLPEMGSTVYMLAITAVLSLALGIPFAMALATFRKEGLHPNTAVFAVLETIMDLLMSMPFIVLAVALTPLTVLIVGSSIGKTAALVPLTIVTTPVFAKFIYDAMIEVNPYYIEGAKSFGASDLQILRLMLKEAVPLIISGTTLSCVNMLSSIAMMGAVGAGGIGAVAIIYGYQRSNYRVIWLVVILLAILTQALQFAGERMYERWK